MGARPTDGLPPGLAAFAGAIAAASDEQPGGGNMMMVVAHPDDETIGFGGQLRRMRHVAIVHVTDGAPHSGDDARAHGFGSVEAYASARRRELEAAMALAGVPPSALLSMGVADQGAPRAMAAIAQDLAELFAARNPRFVLTHPFEGGHPDHDAVALAVWAAGRLMSRQGIEAPVVVEMASYHGGEHGPVVGRFAEAGPELALALGEEDGARKRKMFAAHATQAGVLAQFETAAERFRLAPSHDFRALPNRGLLLYEAKGWGLHGTEWLTLAQDALDALGLGTAWA